MGSSSSNSRPLFDIDNKANNSQVGYPLFLGAELGLMDNIHETYPSIAKLRDKMITDNWVWTEISLSKDAKDIQNKDLASETDIMVKNLSFQYLADSIAEASIGILEMFCSNTELEGLLKFWHYNEYVHAMQYSEIVKTAFPDPNTLMEEVKLLEPAIKRLLPLGKVFDDTRLMGYKYQMGGEIPQAELRKQILRFMGALLSLEAISFAVSFAATFAVGRNAKAYDGIVKAVQLIARDELETHVKADLEIIRILRFVEGWETEYQEVKHELQEFFDTVLENEKEWADYLFSEGRNIVGLNQGNVYEYAKYLSASVYKVLDLSIGFTYPENNNLPWLKDYLDLDAIQVTNQEGQSNNYKVNVMQDDDDGEDLDY